jgi:hypothetical protein
MWAPSKSMLDVALDHARSSDEAYNIAACSEFQDVDSKYLRSIGRRARSGCA